MGKQQPLVMDKKSSGAAIDSQSAHAIQKKVTLTNWKRLTNTAVQFDIRYAQGAFFWRDYVAVFSYNSPRELHIYHLRQGIWSKITAIDSTGSLGSTACTPVVGHAYTVYNGDLIFLSMYGNVSKFITDRWCECPEMNIQWNNPPYAIFATAAVLGDSRSSLIVLEAKSESDNKLFSLCTFRYLQASEANSQWSQPCKLQKSILCHVLDMYNRPVYKYHITFAAIQGYVFVSNGIQTFSLNLISRSAEIIPVAEITQLPHSMYTIASVENTLFAFGGRDEDNQPTSDVYRYNSAANIWEAAGYMRNARYGVTVTSVVQEDSGLIDVFAIGGCVGVLNNSTQSLISRVTESCEVAIA